MALGLIELIVVLIVAALVTRAIGSGHVVFWLGAIVAIVGVVAVGLGIVHRVQRPSPMHEVYEVDETLAAELDARIAHGEMIPDMYGGYGQPISHTTTVRYKAGALFILLPLAVFGAAMAFRRSGLKGLLLGAIGSAALLLCGLFVMRSHSVNYGPPAMVAQITDRAPSIPQPPIDELVDQFTKPRININGTPSNPAPSFSDSITNSARRFAEAVAAVAQSYAESAAAQSAAAAPATHSTPTEQVALVVDQHASQTTWAAEHATDVDIAESAQEDHAEAPVADASQPKPEWVGAPRQYANNVWRVPVEAGPYSTLQECYGPLEEELRQVVKSRIEELARESAGRWAYVPELEDMHLGNTMIERELLAGDPYVENGEASFGPTKTAWALLEFDQDADRRLLEAWQGYARRDGIKITAALSALVLSVLGLAYGLIKVDTWTRGYYSKRLFLGVPAAIIAVVMFLIAANA